jgi:hypothetical protein
VDTLCAPLSSPTQLASHDTSLLAAGRAVERSATERSANSAGRADVPRWAVEVSNRAGLGALVALHHDYAGGLEGVGGVNDNRAAAARVATTGARGLWNVLASSLRGGVAGSVRRPCAAAKANNVTLYFGKKISSVGLG